MLNSYVYSIGSRACLLSKSYLRSKALLSGATLSTAASSASEFPPQFATANSSTSQTNKTNLLLITL
ncbi:MAG: hypothetical protein P8I55_13975 [Crocinitomix sp.]|nr:hypothetical protein [Crocinitomix sp.]